MSSFRAATTMYALMTLIGSIVTPPSEATILAADSDIILDKDEGEEAIMACGVELLQAKLDLEPLLPSEPQQAEKEPEKVRDPEIQKPEDLPPSSVKFMKFPAADFPLARCLDGSQAGLYIRPAKQPSNRFLFYMRDGGACQDAEGCIERSEGWLGSSDEFYRYYDFDKIPALSSSPENPFIDWNMILVPNCDGSALTGRRTTASNDTWGLYFSGHYIMNAGIEYMSRNHGMNSSGSLVVFLGDSQGGVGVMSNLEHWVSLLPESVVLGASIAGIIPEDGPRYEDPDAFVARADLHPDSVKEIVARWDSSLNARCVEEMGSEKNLCFLPTVVYKYLQAPIFILQALTDWRYLKGHRGIESTMLNQTAIVPYLSEFGQNMTRFFDTVDRKRDGVFAPSCYQHNEFNLDEPQIEGSTPFSTLYAWVMARASYADQQQSSNNVEVEEFYLVDSCANGELWPVCGTKCPERKVQFTPNYTHQDDTQ